MADKIAKNAIKTAPDGPDVTFGPFCRLAAREISSLLPIFAKNNVRLIGVGLEPLGVDEFIQGKFFGGELFIDMEKKSYSALGFKRMSLLGLFPAVLAKKARDFAARAKKLNLGGNMKGDGFQNGGALVVEVGGTQTLLTYVQQDAPDHVSNAEVLKALGIEDEPVASAEDVTSTEAWT
ncbi:prostamide/prostaglandin F synthase-like [Tigriopus californicus]|uniref:prostamide/prostaglandin F synthase-like n=1 Tax=Tigriopus californicus TaxID=6832 RepID=UPI0027DA98EE|nr:prostamide/prostaglandin F synthase-like [Tigriopus californicus]